MKSGEKWGKVGKSREKLKKWKKWLGLVICGFMWLIVAKSDRMWLKVILCGQ